MLSQQEVDRFAEEGYLLIKDAVSPVVTARVRQSLIERFDKAKSDNVAHGQQIATDVLSKWPECRALLLNDNVLGAARSLLGDAFVVLAESAAHRQGFGGWHRDTTSQEAAGLTFHRSADYRMVELAFYFQENTERFGGGLEVAPGSHLDGLGFVDRLPHGVARVLNGAGRRARQALAKARQSGESLTGPRNTRPVPSNMGDLVVFDFRLLHRAAQALVDPVPREHEKLAVFFACSRANRHVDAYHRFLMTRPGYEWLHGFSYPADLTEEAAKAGVCLGGVPSKPSTSVYRA